MNDRAHDYMPAWRSYGSDVLHAIEADSNAGGLAAYIEELRAEVEKHRMAQQRVLEWVTESGCWCDVDGPRDTHKGACPGVVERILKKAMA